MWDGRAWLVDRDLHLLHLRIIQADPRQAVGERLDEVDWLPLDDGDQLPGERPIIDGT